MKTFTLCCILFFQAFSFLCAQNTSQLIEKYISEQVKAKKITSNDAFWIVTSENKSSISGVQNIYFRQALNNIEIFGTESSLHLLPDGRELKSINNFVSDIAQKTSGTTIPSISPIVAVQLAAAHLNYIIQEPLVEITLNNSAANEKLISTGGISKREIPVKLMYEKLQNGSVALIWYLSIQHNLSPDWYSIRVNANTGEITGKVNWTNSCSFGHDHENEVHQNQEIFDDHSNHKNSGNLSTGSYEVLPHPIESPLYGGRSVVTNASNVSASPYGWHDTNGIMGAEYTVTQGNNVNVYKAGDINNGYQPNGGSSLIFHYPFNMDYSDENPYLDASLTNLFYWNNIIHDIIYQYGFDETSGNFQKNNYGKGGIGNDHVNAEGLIGWNCNAFFTTPPDGESGLMQMYYCGIRDGSFDNIVTVHEYAHGISIRSTGGPSNSDCLWNDEQMGEGWSDWYGLMLTMDADDSPTDNRTIATYLLNQNAEGAGIRTFPYTTDMTVNPYTYDDVKNLGGPHAIGTVWASILWEMTWKLIDEYGFDADIYNGTGGNNIALTLVTEALKLQPCNPGFVDARDAILAADIALYGGANQCILWSAFAKRGLGIDASQGSTFDTMDGIASFVSPSSLAELNLIEKVCISDSVMTELGGGLPFGGVYSGVGVTDDGNGETFTFNIEEAGIGNHTITYSLPASSCAQASVDTDVIEVVESITLQCVENLEVTIPPGTTYILPNYFENGTITAESNCQNNALIITQTPPKDTELSPGNYIIMTEVEDEYENFSSCSLFLSIQTSLGVDEYSLNANSVKLFPNPTTDNVTIVNKSSIKINSAVLLDASGRLIQKLDWNDGKEEMVISLKSLASGVYFIKLISDKEEIIKSVIKK